MRFDWPRSAQPAPSIRRENPTHLGGEIGGTLGLPPKSHGLQPKSHGLQPRWRDRWTPLVVSISIGLGLGGVLLQLGTALEHLTADALGRRTIRAGLGFALGALNRRSSLP